MVEKTGTPGDRQPDEWQHDLNPDPMAGQNHGIASAHPERTELSAYDVKELHRLLKDFTDDDLKQIIVLPQGSRLKQGATYIDLMDSSRQEFTALGNMEVEVGKYYAPKTEVGYMLWNRLIGE